MDSGTDDFNINSIEEIVIVIEIGADIGQPDCKLL